MAKATESAVDCLRRVLVEPSTAVQFLEPYMPEYDFVRDAPEFIDLATGLEASTEK